MTMLSAEAFEAEARRLAPAVVRALDVRDAAVTRATVFPGLLYSIEVAQEAGHAETVRNAFELAEKARILMFDASDPADRAAYHKFYVAVLSSKTFDGCDVLARHVSREEWASIGSFLRMSVGGSAVDEVEARLSRDGDAVSSPHNRSRVQ